MSDDDLTTDHAATDQPPPEDTETTTEAADTAPDDDQPALRRQAAAYRVRLRATEVERDTLVERLAAHQRTEVERLAVEAGAGGMRMLASGDDLWAAGVVLADVVDEDGQVDPERVKQAVGRVLTERPHWARRWPSLNGGARMPVASEPSLGQVLSNVRPEGYDRR